MKTNMDMNHTHGEAMDGGVTDPFSRDTTGLAEAIAPEIVVLQDDDLGSDRLRRLMQENIAAEREEGEHS